MKRFTELMDVAVVSPFQSSMPSGLKAAGMRTEKLPLLGSDRAGAQLAVPLAS